MKKCSCMCNFTEEVQKSSTALWLFAACSFLIGVIVGFSTSHMCKCGKKCYSKKSVCDRYIDDDLYDEDEIKF